MKLSDYPFSAVEDGTSVIFCLNPDLIITYCNPAWDRFAVQNGGQALCRPYPIGRCILDSISGPDRDYFAKRFRETLNQSEPWERDYECSTADVYRKMRMRVLPMQAVRALIVINSLLVEHPHQIAATAPLEEAYRTEHGLIVMCANCRRTRRIDPNVQIWDWVPRFVQDMPLNITHGICASCREFYYPDSESE